jgi:lipopolysaccharide export system permease protein
VNTPDPALFALLNEIGIIEQLARNRFERAQPDGLRLPHFAVLNHLVRLGDGRTPGQIARAFQLTKATMTNTLQRLEAPQARLAPGHWLLQDVTQFHSGRPLPVQHPSVTLPTILTPDRIEDSVASPDTLSFWALPGFIELLEQSGFSALRHRLQLHSMLSMPFLAIAMALLAAGFSMRHSRQGGAAVAIVTGVAAGFALYVLDRVTGEFGEAGSLPVWLAAWAPTATGMLLALALLLHLEEG